MLIEHGVRPETGCNTETDDLDTVATYLIGRGLAADDPEAAKIFRRLITMLSHDRRRRVTVERAARRLYLSRRSLGRWCRRSGLPQACHVLTFGRVLHTIRYAQDQALTLQKAAAATGWPDAFTLSNATYRLTGLRASEAKARGLIYLAEAWLQRELAVGPAELRKPRPPSCPSCGQEVLVTQREAGRHVQHAS